MKEVWLCGLAYACECVHCKKSCKKRQWAKEPRSPDVFLFQTMGILGTGLNLGQCQSLS